MGKVIEKTPDKEKAKSLKKMSDEILRRVDDTDREKFATQVVEDYYDVIHNLLEAIAISMGKKVKGRGAHAQLISLICDEFGIEESREEFMQSMRKYRNRISYEGFFIDDNYLERNEEKIREIIKELKRILDV